MRKLVLLSALFLGNQGQSHAAMVSATGCAQADVPAANQAANAGDIVQLPAGTARWAPGLPCECGSEPSPRRAGHE
jgi:hypothetical protein